MNKHFTQVMEENRYADAAFLTKQLKMQDGFVISVQAGRTHYCAPREDLAYLHYEQFELGFPSGKEDLILPYAEDKNEPTDTVYGYVPKDVVEAVIAKHGGLVDE